MYAYPQPHSVYILARHEHVPSELQTFNTHMQIKLIEIRSGPLLRITAYLKLYKAQQSRYDRITVHH